MFASQMLMKTLVLQKQCARAHDQSSSESEGCNADFLMGLANVALWCGLQEQ